MPTPNKGYKRHYGYGYHTEFPGKKKEAWVYLYGPDEESFVQGINDAYEDGFLSAKEKKLCFKCIPEAVARVPKESSVCIDGLHLYRVSWNYCDFS